MTKSKQKLNFSKIKAALPSLLAGVVLIALVYVGSVGKYASDVSLSLTTFASDNSYSVSADQLSELYTVADLSSAINLATADLTASNYVLVKTLYDSGQTSTEKIEKPNIIYVSSRGVISYIVKAGDTMESIAKKYGLSTDQIRWSNSLKTTAISEGDTLFLPSVPGIVYTVKSGDTLETIASKYGSSVAEITTLNDLELSGISEGMRIVIKNGTLPTTERPEYVAPVTYSYSYSGSAYSRSNVRVISRYFYDSNYPYPSNPGIPGQCTWYAWWWRATNASSLGQLPGGLSHARYWASQLASRGVSHTPKVGAVFQTSSGVYGHVGVVIAINSDGSITVREMNYLGNYVLTEAEIPASLVSNFNYIY